jgi:hypothetical protein
LATFTALLARQQDRAGRVEPRGLAGVARLGDLIDVGARRIERDIHVGDLGLHQLEAADRLAELLALADVGQDHVEARLHDAELDPGEHGALIIEPAHQHADAAILLAHDVLGRDEAIVEHQLAVGEPRMPILSTFWPSRSPPCPFRSGRW